MNPIIDTGVQAVKHSVMRTVSVICVLLVIAGLWFAVDKAFIHPRKQESYQQKAETITNIEHNFYPNKKVFGLGITLWGWDIGITRYDYPKETKEK